MSLVLKAQTPPTFGDRSDFFSSFFLYTCARKIKYDKRNLSHAEEPEMEAGEVLFNFVELFKTDDSWPTH